jgi:hypothetical protein
MVAHQSTGEHMSKAKKVNGSAKTGWGVGFVTVEPSLSYPDSVWVSVTQEETLFNGPDKRAVVLMTREQAKELAIALLTA